MSTYTPNRWVVLEMTHGDDVINKVFGGWYGGYTGADSWKLVYSPHRVSIHLSIHLSIH